MMFTKRIIVLEDEPIIATSLTAQLNRNGFNNIHMFCNARDALIDIFQEPPALLFLNDKIYGPIQGIRMSLLVRQYFRFPIIFLTGKFKNEIVPYLHQIKPCAIISKPFDEHQILEATKMILN